MKKILFLGAAPTQIPPIQYALDQGHYTITCDYLPENPGHALAHEAHNISTTDKDAVLALAQKLKIDGIVAYASDPAAPTAAYVAEKMNLPGNPYKSVEILARKDLFREYLAKNGFNVPKSQSFYDLDGVVEWIEEIGLPVFVKPVDSSGSKGVTRLQNLADLGRAFEHALYFSREKKVVVEQEIIRQGYQVAGDGFVINGELRFRCWADEHFDKLCNGLVPIGQSFPSSHAPELLAVAHAESQRLLNLLGMKMGAFNFDFIFNQSGDFYFLELGPRNGGCLIPEVTRYATDVDMIAATVDASLGLPVDYIKMKPINGFWASYMVHAIEDGVFKGLCVSEWLKNRIVEKNIWIKEGDSVQKYLGSNDTLGTMIVKYDSLQSMIKALDNMSEHINVIVK